MGLGLNLATASGVNTTAIDSALEPSRDLFSVNELEVRTNTSVCRMIDVLRWSVSGTSVFTSHV